MVQIVPKQGNLFGRIGKGIGQGLADQIPKEIERNRLSSGLKQFEQESGDLSPIQQLSRLSAIPGITPQMIQSFGELAKHQNTRNAYKNQGAPREPRANANQNMLDNAEGPQSIKDIRFANQRPNENQQMKMNQENVRPEEYGQPQINPKNPLRNEAIPKAPWTPERRNQERGDLYEAFPNLTPQEIEGMASDNEARELAQPLAEQSIDNYLNDKQNQSRLKFNEQLETKLQKSGPGIFKDITGEMKNNLERGMERELRTNPNASVDDVVNKWTNKALDLAKAKTQLNALSGSSLFATPILLDKEAYRNKLKNYGDIFNKSGNSEEFFNTLKSDFSMSPQGAASLAYPISKNISQELKNYKPNNLQDYSKNSANARKVASDIEKHLTSDDSLLSIARSLKEKDAFFDEKSFFEQLSSDKDNLRLNERQRRELAEGNQLLPSWGDILILPFFRGL